MNYLELQIDSDFIPDIYETLNCLISLSLIIFESIHVQLWFKKKNEKINIWCSSFYSAIYFYFYFVYFKTCWKYWFFFSTRSWRRHWPIRSYSVTFLVPPPCIVWFGGPRGQRVAPKRKRATLTNVAQSQKVTKRKVAPGRVARGTRTTIGERLAALLRALRVPWRMM